MSATTHQVNFRAESSLYKQAKNTLDNDKVSVSEILNATLRKIATGAIDPVEFISSDTVNNDTFKTAFADLKKEILLGHQAILEGKTTSLADVRKEFNLD
ncbi:antitoxin [Lactococcus garvieae]|uniref:antitoxin n=1 Tax=Lactococcus garvieae TaxID=1363 RepID=UPI00254D7ECA|nr:antitoxin [Lactococcus garvieae]